MGELKPIWRFFGADEPNVATMKDGRKLMQRLASCGRAAFYFRTHNLLNTGDGTAAFGQHQCLHRGRPGPAGVRLDRGGPHHRQLPATRRAALLQIGFMPQALSSALAGTPYQHSWRPGFGYQLIAAVLNAPPKRLREVAGAGLPVGPVLRGALGPRRGEDLVLEVWNEPNLPPLLERQCRPSSTNCTTTPWRACAARCPRRACGGPTWLVATAAPFMDAFAARGQRQEPRDRRDRHADGLPVLPRQGAARVSLTGHVRMGMAVQLKDIATGFQKIAAVPELKGKPIVIGENDPKAARPAPPAERLPQRHDVLRVLRRQPQAHLAAGRAPWRQPGRRADLGLHLEDQPWFAGYRQLATTALTRRCCRSSGCTLLGATQLWAESSGEVPLDELLAQGARSA